MELCRELYQDLIEWKRKDSGHVLELRGARQVGKTFILDKFAKENYLHYIYINMVQPSGRRFLACYKEATAWKPGMPQKEHELHDAFLLFDEAFVDTKDTIVVIDEIQESPEVYSMIRQFAREFICHFVVTGSYLGKTLSREYFQPMGDLDILELYSLSFREFLKAVGKEHVYDNISLIGEDAHGQYDTLKQYFDIYRQIGGYPSVVTTYLQENSIDAAQLEIQRIIQIFIDESEHHFKSVLDMNVFEQTFAAVAQTMVREKKGTGNLIEELAEIVSCSDTNRVTKRSIHQAISWLYRSHIIGYCGQATECDPLNTSMNRRFYFMDLGIAKIFLDMSGADAATIQGLINENFVYIDLLKRSLKRELTWLQPMFGTYKDGEIDFFVRKLRTDKNYGVEVKAGRNAGRTAQKLLEERKIEKLYYLKGSTYGGEEGRIVTVPIYLASRIRYDG